MPKYLIPYGKNGYYYEPEILEVLEKYAELKADLSNEKSRKILSEEIGARLREIPLETTELPDGPIRLLEKDPCE